MEGSFRLLGEMAHPAASSRIGIAHLARSTGRLVGAQAPLSDVSANMRTSSLRLQVRRCVPRLVVGSPRALTLAIGAASLGTIEMTLFSNDLSQYRAQASINSRRFWNRSPRR